MSSLEALKTVLGIAAIVLLLIAPFIAQIALIVWRIRRRVKQSTTLPKWIELQVEALLCVFACTLIEMVLLWSVARVLSFSRQYLGYVGLFFYTMILVYGVIGLVVGFLLATIFWSNAKNNYVESIGHPPLS